MSTENTQVSQKQAVINAVESVLGSSFVIGSTNVKSTINSDQLSEVRSLVLEGIMNGTVIYNKSTTNAVEVKRYVNGMIDNHFRKAKELNGGSKYIAGSTGSTRGTRDEQLKVLNQLQKGFAEGTAEYNNVANAIADRKNQLLAEKQATVKAKSKKAAIETIDRSVLPADLADILSSTNA
jgi:hypothetical protein